VLIPAPQGLPLILATDALVPEKSRVALCSISNRDKSFPRSRTKGTAPMHPSRDELAGLAFGTLDEGTADQIADHVEQCSQCDETMRKLETAADEVIHSLRAPTSLGRFENESGCRDLVSIVQAIGRDPSVVPGKAPDEESESEEALGTIRDYELLAKLGEGGMGAVYKALHTQLQKVVALKVLPVERMNDSQAVERFRREMQAVGRLAHPNIVGAHDAGEHEGTHYLVMEYVEGVDLSELVRRIGPLPVADACELIRQAAIGLQHANEHGLVHRDVKPSNLMLTPQGQLKILDLGLARLHNGQHGELTSTGQMMGTVDYIAPEQTGDSHEVDIRADIYGLGATLYKLLSGETPYANPKLNTVVKKLAALATEDAAAIQGRRPEVSNELATIVHQMLEKDADDRPAKPEDIAEALLPHTEGANLVGLVQQYHKRPRSHDAEAKVAHPKSTDAYLTSSFSDTESSHAVLVADEESQQTTPEDVLTDAAFDKTQAATSTPSIESKAVPPVRLSDSPHPARSRWLVAILAIAAGLGGLILLGAITLYFRTGDTTIVVEIDDPEGLIQVSVDGEDIVITDKERAGEPIKLQSLDCKLHVKRGDLAFATDKFTLNRGDKNVVIVKLVEGQIQVVQDDRVIKSQIAPPPARDPVELASSTRWPLGPENVLPGLVPRPTKLPGVRRWQVETTGPRSEVEAVAWSPDGEFVASGDDDGAVRVYEAGTLQLARLLLGHTDGVQFVAWSPDGEMLASASNDKTVRLWHRDGKPGPVLKGHDHHVMGVTWSPNGQQFASAGADNTIRIWNRIGTMERVIKVPEKYGNSVFCVAWHPDGERLVSGHYSGWTCLWRTDGKLEAELPGHITVVESVAWSPDGQKLASASGDNTVRLWSSDGTPGAVLRHPGSVHCVAWSFDGQLLASSCEGEHAVRVWKADGTPGADWEHGTGPQSVAWSPDAHRLVTGGGEIIRTWDADGNSQGELVFDTHSNGNPVAWSPNGQYLASVYSRGVRLWQPDGTPDSVFKDDVSGGFIAWSPSGTTIAFGTYDNLVLVNVDGTPGVDRHSPPPPVEFNAVSWRPDSNQLASAGGDATIRLWEADGTPGLVLDEHPGVVHAIAWSPDGKRLASAEDDETLRLWQADGTPGPIFKGHTSDIMSVAWSPDGEWIATGSREPDISIRLWKPDGTAGPVLEGHTKDIPSLTWSPDSERLVSGSWDRTVRLWNRDGTAGPVLTGDAGIVRSVSWSPDGKRIASGVAGYTILVRTADTGDPEWMAVFLPEHQTAVFSGGGKLLRGDPEVVEKELAYLVENEDGTRELLKPSEFHRRFASPSTEPTDTPDRRVAEWVLAKGGDVKVSASGEEYEVQKPEQLPEQAFELNEVFFHGVQNVGDDDLIRFTDLSHLKRVEFDHSPITDAGIQHLNRISSLEWLELPYSQVTDDGVALLKDLPNLRILVVGGTNERTKGLGDGAARALSEMEQLEELDLIRCHLTDTGLEHLSQLSGLKRLEVSHTDITDDGIEHISRLSELLTLDVSHNEITDAAMPHIAKLRNLTELSLGYCQITDKGIANLSALPRLQTLQLSGTKLTREGLAHLGSLKNLSFLTLDETAAGDAGLAHLAQLPKLRRLYVYNCGITDAGLAHVSGIKTLGTLHLGRNPITDTGLEQLYQLSNLELLTLNETDVTAAGIAKLKLIHPDCTIGSDFTDEQIAAEIAKIPPDRRAAIWVLGIHGKVDVMVDGQRVNVERPEDLPTDAFHLEFVGFENNSRVTDSGLQQLVGLEHLIDLRLRETPVTDVGMEHVAKLTNLSSLSLWDTDIGDEGMRHVASLKRLSSLAIYSTQVTDAGFRHIAGMKDLETLHATDTPSGDGALKHLKNLAKLRMLHAGNLTTDNGLKHLGELHDLESLDLVTTQVTGSGFVHLHGLAKLEDLNLNGSPISDEGLRQLRGIPNLKELILESPQVTEAGLAHLKDLPLTKLIVARMQVTDAGVEHVASLKQLQSLDLTDNKITDTGLEHLESLENLQELYINGTKVTAAGVARLQKALPDCEIVWDGDDDPHLALAFWMFGRGGSVSVEVPNDPRWDKHKELRSIDELPDKPFSIHDADLRQGESTTDAVLARFGELASGIQVRSVDLSGTAITDAGLTHLARVTSLEELGLSSTFVTDAGLIHLREMKNLKRLSLDGIKITGDGVKYLAELSSLEYLAMSTDLQRDRELEHLGRITWLTSLSLNHGRISDLGLRHLSGLTNLEHLGISATELTDAGLEHLTVHRNLQTLVLFRVRLGDEGAEHLAKITSLTQLSLDGGNLPSPRTQIGDEHVLTLTGSLTKLSVLDLIKTQVTDKGLANLKNLSRLKQLHLGGNGITDDGLVHLAGLRRLEELMINEPNVTDGGMVHLKDLRSLRRLELYDTAVSDAGLEHLTGLTRLESLDLTGTFVTAEGAAKLKEALPDCKIQFGQRDNPHLMLAKTVFNLGGRISIATPDGSIGVPSLDKLPAEPFQIAVVGIHDRDLTDEQLNELSTACNSIRLTSLNLSGSLLPENSLSHFQDRWIGSLQGYDTTIVDDDLSALRNIRGLWDLVLSETNVTDACMQHVAQATRLTSVNVSRTKVGDDGLRQLQAMPHLQSLDLSHSKITDKGLEHLKVHQNLDVLLLHSLAITDVGVKHLGDIKSLHRLEIHATPIGDEAARQIARLTKLESLTLANTKLTDIGLRLLVQSLSELTNLILDANTAISGEGLADIGKLQQLTTLRLQGVKVRDEELAYLESLTELRFLNLSDTKIAGPGLVHLKDLKNLEELGLGTTGVSDVDLEHLSGLKSLKNLELRGTKVTATGVARLQKALPDCEIMWDAP
jgi:WD40 repeat protein/serine/threonine protein kinase/Leucine-rich repeat (LRR) protein